MSDDPDALFEILGTTRAMRRLKPDPVPDALIRRILEAGSCAANGANAQNWRFLVVKDESIKRSVAVWYLKAFEELVAPNYLHGDPPPGVPNERFMRQYEAVRYLSEHFHEAPVWIVPCLSSREGEAPRSVGSSIYPAVQNMLLAARVLGLGATLTTRHLQYEQETEAALGIPEGIHSYAILPIGYPMGRFGPVSRRPPEEIAYLDRWGEPFTAR